LDCICWTCASPGHVLVFDRVFSNAASATTPSLMIAGRRFSSITTPHHRPRFTVRRKTRALLHSWLERRWSKAGAPDAALLDELNGRSPSNASPSRTYRPKESQRLLESLPTRSAGRMLLVEKKTKVVGRRMTTGTQHFGFGSPSVSLQRRGDGRCFHRRNPAAEVESTDPRVHARNRHRR